MFELRRPQRYRVHRIVAPFCFVSKVPSKRCDSERARDCSARSVRSLTLEVSALTSTPTLARRAASPRTSAATSTFPASPPLLDAALARASSAERVSYTTTLPRCSASPIVTSPLVKPREPIVSRVSASIALWCSCASLVTSVCTRDIVAASR